jgi:hypothetical protein
MIKILIYSLPFYLIAVYVLLCVKIAKGSAKIHPFVFLILGMIIGMTTGFTSFYALDQTNGWNPYGWWWPASFLLTVFSGIISVLIYGTISKKSNREKESEREK